MFFKSSRTWYTNSGQHASGSFLMVFQDPLNKDRRELRALARHVKLSQCGHWMMGRAKIGENRFLSVSGGFGSDGLPMSLGKYYDKDNEGHSMTVEEMKALWDQLVPVPQELAERYWKADDGHNSVPGSVAGDFRKWALENLKALRKTIR